MAAISLYTLYNYFQRSLLINNSSSSFATLLLQAHKKLSFLQQDQKIKSKPITAASALSTKDQHRLHILYPSRNPVLSTDTFFSSPKVIIQQQLQHQHQQALKTKTKKPSVDAVEKIKRKSQSISPITPNYVAPREPIVLCHGLFGFDIRGPEKIPALQFRYWSGVEDTLAKLGAKIIVTKVPRAGSIWERSQTLHTLLKSILVGKSVNFVAHSMGGLDCRHLLANFQDRPYNVQSLTTICTPHRGSPVMDWFRDNLGVGVSQAPHNNDSTGWSPSTAATTISTKNNTLRHECALSSNTTTTSKWGSKVPAWDKVLVNWFDEPAYAHLTTDFCNDYFNPNTPDDPSVKYYSYGAAAEMPAWSSLLGLSYQLVKEKEGENDGIVSVNSAKWGTYIKTVNADHWELNGKNRIPYRFKTSSNKGPEFDRLDFYAELATHLYNQGH